MDEYVYCLGVGQEVYKNYKKYELDNLYEISIFHDIWVKAQKKFILFSYK